MSENNKQIEPAKSVVAFLDKYGERLFNEVRNISKKAADETRVNWRLGYERYLNNALNKYYFVKTFLSNNEPLPLYELYVPLTVYCGQTQIKKASVKDFMSAGKFFIITASGGSGKTMMMRHLFVDTINNTHQVPIFVELRELNNLDLSLFQFIKKKLRDNEFNFRDEYIEKAFEAGHFTLLLDGFDEVADSKRQDVINQIEEIADRYEKNYIFLSSRPDDSLYKWTLFNISKVSTLTVDLACELVEKTEADEDIKEKFISALRKELFYKHQSFLSNPLLLAIMLITYKDSANIPHKISTFYERAYTALFEQHDARKAFHRQKLSKLDILEFRKVFAAFCFLTYNKSLYSFSETEVFDYFDKAQKATGISFEKGAFLHDCIQAVCLLIRDGLDITFSHRSFQEYFTALFVSQMTNSKLQKKFIVNKFDKFFGELYFGSELETLFNLLFEISPETIERRLLIPKLTELEERIGCKDKLENDSFKKLMTTIYSNMTTSESYRYYEEDEFIAVKEGREIGVRIKHIGYERIINIIKSHYVKAIKYDSLNSKSKFFKLFMDNYTEVSREFNEDADIVESIPIANVLENEGLFKTLANGNSWLSKKKFQDILDVKNQLIEKHKEQEKFLEEEFYSY